MLLRLVPILLGVLLSAAAAATAAATAALDLYKHVLLREPGHMRRWWLGRRVHRILRLRHRLLRLRTSSKPVDTLSICIMRRLYIWACHTYIWDPESVGQ